MSFNVVKVGKPVEVIQELKSLDMQDGLGADVRDMLVSALQQQASIKNVIVKAQGHSDVHHINLNVSVETVY